jgi:aquaporin Z
LLNFSHYWVYLVGPIVGALLAVPAGYALRGPGGDEAAIQAAQGRLDEYIQPPSKEGTRKMPSGADNADKPDAGPSLK